MKTAIRISTAVAIAIFAWYIVADRITPYTGNARVKALVVAMVPQVAGYVSAVPVTNGQVVEPGQLLARIDPQPFLLQVEKARSDLQLATQEVGASSAQVEAAQAELAQARAQLENTQSQSERTFTLARQGIATRAAADQAQAQLLSAQGRVTAAEAELERARQQLGATGADNARIQAAIAALGLAEINLRWTELRAPGRGAVVDLQITEGTFAPAGQRLMTFVSFEEVWVEAYMTENNLGRIAVGNAAELSLDVYPGRIFQGTVTSITIAAAAPHAGTSSDGLPKPPEVSGWMRDPQRFPVRIRMEGYGGGSEAADIRRQVNGQADVVVYTGGNAVLNGLAAAWIRFMSWISYAY
ncbi:HlyD family secretion protein [Roseomonas sp. PWR1]|uniref:HlyD family secretion protein n=1 Tax=Roseomonas nitratireducens TaxID=2820810 RepID=A0ABS4ATN9_9PROT|nr:HlyD family secretion protein [Neoroseomonas nitratireducens]MBP0464203.1 HlyD family secretion protein [Neoroseomonas nitratireducens]